MWGDMNMPQCKCKMCGVTLSFSETDKTATCEFCGTDAINKYKNNISRLFVIAGISLGLYNLTIDA